MLLSIKHPSILIFKCDKYHTLLVNNSQFLSMLNSLCFHPIITQGNGERNLKIIDCKRGIRWFGKGDVNGSKTREVFSYLKREMPREDGSTDVLWNYEKFLVDAEGRPFSRYNTQLNAEKLQDDIDHLLKVRGPSKKELKKIEMMKKKAALSTDIFAG